MTDRALTAAEVAEIMGVTERYVWRLGRDGALPRVKHPGRKYVRFMLSDVLAYLEAGRAEKTLPTARGSSGRVSPPPGATTTSRKAGRRRF